MQDSDIVIARTQFPFRLAYALTFNKAQGQTLDCVVVDLTPTSTAEHGGAFAHGHLYVALTRVRTRAHCGIIIADKHAQPPLGAHIVHSSLLSNAYSAQSTMPTPDERRATFQRLRPGSRIGHRHLRPAGYQGPINHLYDSHRAFGPSARPRCAAHQPYVAIGNRRALAQRLNMNTKVARRTAAEQQPRAAAPAAISVTPRRSLPFGTRAAMLARLSAATHLNDQVIPKSRIAVHPPQGQEPYVPIGSRLALAAKLAHWRGASSPAPPTYRNTTTPKCHTATSPHQN